MNMYLVSMATPLNPNGSTKIIVVDDVKAWKKKREKNGCVFGMCRKLTKQEAVKLQFEYDVVIVLE